MSIFINIDLSSLLVRMETAVAAPPSRVFEALTGDLSDWWGFPFLINPEDAVGVSLEPRLGGMLVESWGDGEGIVLGMVSRLKRDRYLTLQGYMSLPGPLAGLVDFELEPAADGGTRLHLSHSACGTFDWQAQRHYETGWRSLLGTRLKGYVEEGKTFEFLV